MHLDLHFERFYDRIKLDATREARIRDGLLRLSKTIEGDALQQYLVSAPVPQGSWAQGTIVKPPSAAPDFDVDILLPMEFNRFPAEWRTSSKILDYVRRRLSPYYGAQVRTRDKCVRIQYGESDGFHIDVVPAHVRESSSGPFQICSKKRGFILTHPLEMTAWVSIMDKATRGHFSRSIVCLKRWRDLKMGPSAPSSILLTCLAGQALQRYEGHRNLQTTTLSTLEAYVHDLAVCMRNHLESGPAGIPIPGSGDDLYPGWSQSHHDSLLKRLHALESRAEKAIAQRSTSHAINHWRSQFGVMFPGDLH